MKLQRHGSDIPSDGGLLLPYSELDHALGLTELGEKEFGPDRPQTAFLLNNPARLYKAQSRYAEAEPLHKRALAIVEKALGPDHPDVGETLKPCIDPSPSTQSPIARKWETLRCWRVSFRTHGDPAVVQIVVVMDYDAVVLQQDHRIARRLVVDGHGLDGLEVERHLMNGGA